MLHDAQSLSPGQTGKPRYKSRRGGMSLTLLNASKCTSFPFRFVKAHRGIVKNSVANIGVSLPNSQP